MIITVEGTLNNNNNAAALIAALAPASVLEREKKVLILQLMNDNAENVETYLIGKQYLNMTLDETAIDINDGMDALLVYMDNPNISPTIFSECTRSMVQSSTKNLFDVAASSRKADFEQEFLALQENIATFLHNAQVPYNLVFILLPSNNPALCEAVLEYSDINIICVPQGPGDTFTPGKNNLFVCADFDPMSKFNAKSLAKHYNTKRIYQLVSCTGYHDALAEGTVLNFISTNYQNTRTDIYYDFSTELNHLIDAILGKDLHLEPDTSTLKDRQVQEEHVAARTTIGTQEPATERVTINAHSGAINESTFEQVDDIVPDKNETISNDALSMDMFTEESLDDSSLDSNVSSYSTPDKNTPSENDISNDISDFELDTSESITLPHVDFESDTPSTAKDISSMDGLETVNLLSDDDIFGNVSEVSDIEKTEALSFDTTSLNETEQLTESLTETETLFETETLSDTESLSETELLEETESLTETEDISMPPLQEAPVAPKSSGIAGLFKKLQYDDATVPVDPFDYVNPAAQQTNLQSAEPLDMESEPINESRIPDDIWDFDMEELNNTEPLNFEENLNQTENLNF